MSFQIAACGLGCGLSCSLYIAAGDRFDQGRPQQQREQQEVDEQEMQPQDMGVPDEMAWKGPTAAAVDIDLPDHTANDIFLLEEEVEVER